MHRLIYFDGLRFKVEAPDFFTLTKNLAEEMHVKIGDFVLIFNGSIINNNDEYNIIAKNKMIYMSPKSDSINININSEDIKTHAPEIYDKVYQPLTELLLIEQYDISQKYQLIKQILDSLVEIMYQIQNEIVAYHQKEPQRPYQLLDKLAILLKWHNNLYLIKTLNDSKLNNNC